MQARAGAVDELIASGALDDGTAEPGGDIQRQLDALTSGSSVDAELAKMKAELGAGAPAPKEIPAAGGPAAAEESK
jgi:phage shock protein A